MGPVRFKPAHTYTRLQLPSILLLSAIDVFLRLRGQECAWEFGRAEPEVKHDHNFTSQPTLNPAGMLLKMSSKCRDWECQVSIAHTSQVPDFCVHEKFLDVFVCRLESQIIGNYPNVSEEEPANFTATDASDYALKMTLKCMDRGAERCSYQPDLYQKRRCRCLCRWGSCMIENLVLRR